MANDFKPATDLSLADLNRANRDAWDSGEFRHEDVYPARHMNLQEIKNSHYPGSVAEHHPKGIGTPIGAKETAAIKAGKRKPYLPKKTEASIKHMNDELDVRHPKTGGQQIAGESGEVIVHAHDEHDRAVRLPRTRKRTWKNGVWS